MSYKLEGIKYSAGFNHSVDFQISLIEAIKPGILENSLEEEHHV